jgi:Sad1 / UNC-like C-terminal
MKNLPCSLVSVFHRSPIGGQNYNIYVLDAVQLTITHCVRVMSVLIYILSGSRPWRILGGAFLCQAIAIKMSCTLNIKTLPIVTLTSFVEVSTCETELIAVLPILNQLVARVGALEAATLSLPQENFDSLLRRDFALHAGGGDVVAHLTSPTYPIVHRSFTSWLLASLRGYEFDHWGINPAHTALEKDIGVGSCWAIDGAQGHLGIRLSERTRISEIIISHVGPGLVSPADIRRTPRHMILWGLTEDSSVIQHSAGLDTDVDHQFRTMDYFVPSAARPPHKEHFIHLAEFSYENMSPHRSQSFPITLDHNDGFNVVVLQILDNWGANSTCLYHIGVYGEGLDQE